MRKSLHIGLVGPLPPPSGGMANQTQQLAKLLSEEGLTIELVQTNRPYQPIWVGHIVIVRAFFRLIFYVIHLWNVAAHVDLFHVMANSGWSWHLFTVPAVWIARFRQVPVVINYRGGEAAQFFEQSFRWIKPTLETSSCVVVPSRFLEEVFMRRDIETKIVSNIIDLERFSSLSNSSKKPVAPHLLVARNLEQIYDNATAIRAFKEILKEFPNATLTIAGTGPEKPNLVALVNQSELEGRVTFTGRVDTQQMPALYQSAHVMLNPSRVDNMPNSVLESLASGVPVVSTNVGGIPFLVEHEKNVLLVPPQNSKAMTEAVCHLLKDDELTNNLTRAGLALVQQFSWPVVREQWLDVYQQVIQ